MSQIVNSDVNNNNDVVSQPATTANDSKKSVSFVWSYMSLLSGGIDDCQNADDETCSAGISAARAFLRHNSDGIDTEGSLMISRLDYESVFVNMHPLDWGVNRLVLHDRFGYDLFYAYRSLIVSTTEESKIQKRDPTTLQTKDLQVLLGNVVVATSHVYSQYTKNIHLDDKTGLAVIVIDDAGKSAGEAEGLQGLGTLNRVDKGKAVRGLMNFIAQENQARGCSDTISSYDLYLQSIQGNANNNTVSEQQNEEGRTSNQKCWIPIVVFEDTREDLFQDFLQDVISIEKNAPALIAQVRSYDASIYNTPQQVGPHGMWVVSFRTVSYQLAQLRLELSDDRRKVTNVTLVEENLWVIPDEIKDAEFRDDIAYLRTLADEAKRNNPIQGTSLAMPAARLAENEKYTPCMGGECPVGNLFADALRWWTRSDFAFVNSGGIRGPGWPEGPVRVGNIWEALPFANTQCTGIISGINLFRIFQQSTTEATFQSTWTSSGDKLFQVSGIRYTYNTELEAPRLVKLEIWDDIMQSYKPVERLQMYRFATSSWMCSGFDPFPSMLGEGLTVEGEQQATIGDTLMQNIVGEYLTYLDEPFNTTIHGRLVNDTSATERLDFIQTQDSCGSSTYWVEKFLTCMDCPNTDQVVIEGPEANVVFDTVSGSDDVFSGTAEIVNGELFPVIVALKSKPEWISFSSEEIWKDDEGQKITIAPGDSYPFSYDVSALKLSPGLATGPISFAVLDGGNYPGCVGRDALHEVSLKIANQPEFSQPGSVMIVGFTLMCTVLCTAIALAVWVYRNMKKREVSSMQPYFLVALCFGVSIISLSILPLSIRDLDISATGQNMACMATPWLLSVGFAIVMSTLFSKLWRINKLFSGPRFRRITVTSRESLFAFGTILSTNVLLMLLWTLIDPLEYEIRFVENEDWKLYSTCSSSKGSSWVFLLLTIGINFVAMSLAIYEAYKARNISDDYSESKSLGIAVYSWIQILLVGCPVLFLIDEDNVVPRYFLQVALIFVSCMSMMLIIFVPLIIKTESMKSSRNGRGSTLRISGLNFSFFNTSEGGVSYPLSFRSNGFRNNQHTGGSSSERVVNKAAASDESKPHSKNKLCDVDEIDPGVERAPYRSDDTRGHIVDGSSRARSISEEQPSTCSKTLDDHEAACTTRVSMVDSCSEVTIHA